MMGEEIELATESVEAVVRALTEEANAFGPVREYMTFIQNRVHMRYLPKLAERAMETAEKIKASGLPRRAWDALDEPLVTAILEGMAEEGDEDLASVWENLLANALTESRAQVRRAYPELLRQLEPPEALMLDRIANKSILVQGSSGGMRAYRSEGQEGVSTSDLPNLERLDLIALGPVLPATRPGARLSSTDALRAMHLTQFGDGFLGACRPPEPPDPRQSHHDG